MNLIAINQSINTIIEQTQANMPILIYIVLIPWTVFFLVILSNRKLLILGIIPRHWQSLLGIFCAPFLHTNFNHLFFNTIPLVVLSNFLLIQGLSYFLLVSFYIILLSGIGIWCFGKSGIHVGASALITGYWALLIINAYEHGGIINIFLGTISLYYFIGIFLGIFPNKKNISWEGHLFGLLAGLATGYYLAYYNF